MLSGRSSSAYMVATGPIVRTSHDERSVRPPFSPDRSALATRPGASCSFRVRMESNRTRRSSAYRPATRDRAPANNRGRPVMTFAERALYHQIHPAKLFADIATALVGIDVFWRHALVPGLIIALLPPVLVSVVLMHEGDFERYR